MKRFYYIDDEVDTIKSIADGINESNIVHVDVFPLSEHKEFDRDGLLQFIKRKCSVPEQKNVFNENTIKKDINVLLQTYMAPTSLKSLEDFSALMIILNLIQSNDDENKGSTYYFNEIHSEAIAPEIITLQFD